MPAAWVLAAAIGALFTACGGPPTLRDVEDRVFTKSCVFTSCHLGASAQAGLNLEPPTREKLLRASTENPSKPIVAPGDPDGSFILDKLLNRNIPTMGPNGELWTPMPPTGPIEAERIALVREWIAAGALDD